MVTPTRIASWETPADRKAPAVWLGIFWLGIIIGFGVDLPGFLRERPSATGIIYIHAVVFLGWLVLLTVQVAFVLRGRMNLHRRMGSKAGYVALFMVPLGLATALTAAAQGHEHPRFIILQLVDLLGFITFIALGLKYRNNPTAHKRLMMLAMVSIADPGFNRAIQYLYPDPRTPLDWFLSLFYGDLLLLTAMFCWDLWRRRRVHPALLIGGTSLVGVELLTAFVYFSPTWNAIATSMVHAWEHAGGML